MVDRRVFRLRVQPISYSMVTWWLGSRTQALGRDRDWINPPEYRRVPYRSSNVATPEATSRRQARRSRYGDLVRSPGHDAASAGWSGVPRSSPAVSCCGLTAVVTCDPVEGGARSYQLSLNRTPDPDRVAVRRTADRALSASGPDEPRDGFMTTYSTLNGGQLQSIRLRAAALWPLRFVR